jgi:peptide deformylase
MAILKTALMGNRVLTQVAEPVAEPSSPAVARLAAAMQETLEQIGVNGLAAPQVFVPKRLIVYRIPACKIPAGARLSPIPWRTLVNPELMPLTKERRPIGLERCVSIPGLHGEVPRWTGVRVRAQQLDGSPIEIVAAGYHARLLQHEIDHLNGILFPMRMTDLSKLGFNSERDEEDFVLRSPAQFQH